MMRLPMTLMLGLSLGWSALTASSLDGCRRVGELARALQERAPSLATEQQVVIGGREYRYRAILGATDGKVQQSSGVFRTVDGKHVVKLYPEGYRSSAHREY